MYLTDDLPSHPKILRAGGLLGTHGADRALALYVAAIAYARKHMTDGFLPDAFVVNSRGEKVAKALSDSGINLFRRVRGGYVIHDFHDYNRSAKEEKDFRRKERERVATWRAKQQGRKP